MDMKATYDERLYIGILYEGGRLPTANKKAKKSGSIYELNLAVVDFSAPRVIMKFICWNVRGLGSPRAFKNTIEFLKMAKARLIFLSKTRCDEPRMRLLMNALGLNNLFTVFDSCSFVGYV